jgi:hypothetical protein
MLGSRTPRGARSYFDQHKSRQAQDLRDCARMLGISADEFRHALLTLGTQQETSREVRKARTGK